MTNIIQGHLEGNNLRIGIVVSRFNHFVTEHLLTGALDCLQRHGVKENDITVVYCPGAFEIPLVAKQMASKNDIDAVICLGAVIRGATSHYDLVCNEAAKVSPLLHYY